MIPHRALENRLNAVKKGKDIPKAPNNNFVVQEYNNNSTNKSPKKNNTHGTQNSLKKHMKQQTKKKLSNVFQFVYRLLGIGISSLIYGYAINILLSQSWGIFGCFTIGYIVLHIFSIINNVIERNKK